MGGAVTKLELQANTAHIFGQPDPGKEDAKQKKRREEEELTEVRTLRISPGAILGATFAAMGGREGIRVEGLTPGGAWANSGDARIDDVVLKVNGKSALKLSRSELLGQLYKQTSPYNVSVISARGLARTRSYCFMISTAIIWSLGGGHAGRQPRLAWGRRQGSVRCRHGAIVEGARGVEAEASETHAI